MIKKKWEIIAKHDYGFYLEFVNHNYNLAPHTRLICDKLQEIERGELKRLIITLPPRHSKSMTVTESFPSWYIGRNPNKRVICVSYGDALSRDFGIKNRQKLEEHGKSIFGIELDQNTQSEFKIKGAQGQAVFTGIGGSLTGKGANLIIIDDVIKNQEQAGSKVYRDKIYNEYRSSLLTRLTSDGAIIIIMTRWNEDDLVGRVLADEPEKWDVLNLPAICEDLDDPLGRPLGAPLWGEFGFTIELLEERKKALGEQIFASLYQQRPAPAQGNIIQRKHFKFYEVLPNLDEILISVDATFKDAKTSDFCVMQVWGKAGANRYLIDQVRDRMDFTTTVNTLRNLVAQYPRATAKLIEDKANGTAVINYLRNEISGLVPVNPEGGKVTRTYAVSPIIESGNVYLPKNKSWIQELIEECVIFPNGKHDDQLDCMTQALNYMNKPNEIFIGRA
jgi:predicted phage terminase large subunit-like protein